MSLQDILRRNVDPEFEKLFDSAMTELNAEIDRQRRELGIPVWEDVDVQLARTTDYKLAVLVQPRRYSYLRRCLHCGRPVSPTFDMHAGDNEHGTYETCCF